MADAPPPGPFVPPADPRIRIWRYMDFTKFVSLLENQGLFFARSTHLDDPFEGSYSRANERLRPIVYEKIEVSAEVLAQMFKSQSDFGRWNRQWVMVNSWHMNEGESAAMWKLYAKTDEAVCIQSTYERLRRCLDDTVYISVVQYIDYEVDWMPEGNVFYPFLHKRKSFEHERELRAIIWQLPVKDEQIDRGAVPNDAGVWKQVELGELIEAVYVAPTAPSWFHSLVQGVSMRYNLGKKVVQSALDREPFY